MEIKIVIVGHVDHGKSTLIGRLLYDTGSLAEGFIEDISNAVSDIGKSVEFAYIVDQLREERENDMTIDTMQFFFRYGGRDYVIIDAPGHKEFIKNMVTGANKADIAVLVVAADEGIGEQTRRHSYLLNFLGIRNVLVVVNKMDVINYNENKFIELRDNVKGIFDSLKLNALSFIPISAKKGDNVFNKSSNMDWYNGFSLLGEIERFSKVNHLEDNFVFCVQDIYDIDGRKIVVGRIESGSVYVDDIVNIFPLNNKAKVKSIELFGENRRKASCGECIGLEFYDCLGIKAGMVISKENLNVVKKLNVNTFWMSNNPLFLDDRLTIKCATQESTCIVESINNLFDSSMLELIKEKSDKLEYTQVAHLVLNLSNPLVIHDFNKLPQLGRVVLGRDGNLVAGGLIKQ